MFAETARKQYTELGFDTLPLVPGTKKAYPRSWQQRSVYSLWKNAPENANIGIRAGGPARVSIIDADEDKQPGTFENVIRWLAGLGYTEFPVVQTASRIGRHVYVTLTDALPGNVRNLARNFGAGEFRYGPGSYVVAPPSVVNDSGVYLLIAGDFQRLPTITSADILPILGNQEISSPIRPNISREAERMLKGYIPDRHKDDRSNAEQGLILSLVNVGYSYQQVLDLFNNNPCAGHYTDLCRLKGISEGLRYLQMTFDKACKFHERESFTRQTILSLITLAKNRPWPGRTGITNQRVYIAFLEMAHKAGRFDIAASCRDVAVIGGINKNTASKALGRLVNIENLLSLEQGWEGQQATRYRVIVDYAKLIHSQSTPPVRECMNIAEHEAFRRGKGRIGLGPTAGQIYQTLQEAPATLKELHRRTGRDIRTVKANLKRMAKIVDHKTGEIINMVEVKEEIWKALPCDLDKIAKIVGTKGATERQKMQHIKDRREHAASLLKGY